MLKILNREAGVVDEALLQAAFCMRAKVMHTQMGWIFDGQNTEYDQDQFDTDQTLHFISATDSGEVIAYGRLNPTMTPHMFSELFADHCDLSGVVCRPRVFEHSRYLVDKNILDKEQWRRHRGAVEVGIAMLSAEAGLEGITWLSSMAAYSHVAKISPGTRPLGLPIRSELDDCDYIAAFSESIPAAIPMMAAYYQFDEQMLQSFNQQVRSISPTVIESIAAFERSDAA